MGAGVSGRIPPGRRVPVGLVTLYAATAILGTALFFFLHYLGNQIPYELAQRRFAAEFEANPQFQGVPDGRQERFGNCEISLMILAGAHRDAAYHPLVDAVLMRSFNRDIAPRGDACRELRAASVGVKLTKGIAKPRYWWGYKALSAIALRYLTVPELYRLILVTGFGAWLLLAAAVALMGWRVLLVVGPTIVFGMAFSDIVRFADLAHGISYSWAVLATALLALLLLRPATARWAPWFCFVTGMTSSYLWFFDGHTTLALALIGLVAWLGYERLGPSGGTRRAAVCIALYVAGFALCYALGQVTKAAVEESSGGNNYHEGTVGRALFRQVSRHWDRMAAEMTATADRAEEGTRSAGVRDVDVEQACVYCRWRDWHKLPIVREFIDFLPRRWAAIELSVFSVLALAGAAVVAVRQAWRGRWKVARGALWLVALALLVLVQFLLPNDVPFRESRFVFLVLATCWMCLVLAMLQLDRRGSTILAGCLVGGLLAGVAAAKPVAGWWLDRTLATTRHVIQSDFDIYLDEDDNRLIYVRNECRGADIEPPFFLHVIPIDRTDLPEPGWRHGFDNRDFDFNDYGIRVGGHCVAMRPLPDYDVAVIRTGQFVPGGGRMWAVEVDFEEWLDRTLATARHVIQSDFDVYLDEANRRLIYVKDECSSADVEPLFFLHIIPVDHTDLPEPRRRYGADNRDFDFGGHGTLVGGRCRAMRILPDYDVAVIRTGQFVPGVGRMWAAEVDFEES